MQKKQKAYKEMADKQLDDIIATMMSVSNVLEEPAERHSSYVPSVRYSEIESRTDSEYKLS